MGGRMKTSQLLMKQAPCIPVNSRFPIEDYYERAERLLRQAMIYRAGQDQFNLFVIQARFSSLLLDTIPKHQNFKQQPQRYKALNEPLCRAISELESLKRVLDAPPKQPAEQQQQQRGPGESDFASSGAAAKPAAASPADLPFDDLSIVSTAPAPASEAEVLSGGSGKVSEGEEGLSDGWPADLGQGQGQGQVDLLTGTEADLVAASSRAPSGGDGGANGSHNSINNNNSATSASTGNSGHVSYPVMVPKSVSGPVVVPEIRRSRDFPPPSQPSSSVSAPPGPPALAGQATATAPIMQPQPQQQAYPPPPPGPPPPQNRPQQNQQPQHQRLHHQVAAGEGEGEGELGMTAHRPKVVENFPTQEVADMDYMNLADRLKHYGLKEKKVKGDGNCQFRSLSDQLFGTTDRHAEVRRVTMGQLRSQSDLYKPYVPEDFEAYVATMSKDGEWGDHVTLQAAADVYGRRICVLSSYKTSFIIDIKPQKSLHPRVLWLSFWAEVHYNSLYPSSSSL